MTAVLLFLWRKKSSMLYIYQFFLAVKINNKLGTNSASTRTTTVSTSATTILVPKQEAVYTNNNTNASGSCEINNDLPLFCHYLFLLPYAVYHKYQPVAGAHQFKFEWIF